LEPLLLIEPPPLEPAAPPALTAPPEPAAPPLPLPALPPASALPLAGAGPAHANENMAMTTGTARRKPVRELLVFIGETPLASSFITPGPPGLGKSTRWWASFSWWRIRSLPWQDPSAAAKSHPGAPKPANRARLSARSTWLATLEQADAILASDRRWWYHRCGLGAIPPGRGSKSEAPERRRPGRLAGRSSERRRALRRAECGRRGGRG